jgi:hypothetical protein
MVGRSPGRHPNLNIQGGYSIMSGTSENQGQPTKEAMAIANSSPQSTTVVPLTINLPAFYDDRIEDFKEACAVNLGHEDQSTFEEIKIPSGGGIAFEITDKEGKPSVAMEIVGVIIAFYTPNAWYLKPYEETGGGEPPDCYSKDGISGVGNPGGNCTHCPKNQFGSDPMGGPGKACKNKTVIFVLTEDSIVPYKMPLPPTSKGAFRGRKAGYMNRLIRQSMPIYGVVTSISLEKDKNAKGTEYSKAVFSKVKDLTREERQKIRAFIELIRPAMDASIEFDLLNPEQPPEDEMPMEADPSASEPATEGGKRPMWS